MQLCLLHMVVHAEKNPDGPLLFGSLLERNAALMQKIGCKFQNWFCLNWLTQLICDT